MGRCRTRFYVPVLRRRDKCSTKFYDGLLVSCGFPRRLAEGDQRSVDQEVGDSNSPGGTSPLKGLATIPPAYILV